MSRSSAANKAVSAILAFVLATTSCSSDDASIEAESAEAAEGDVDSAASAAREMFAAMSARSTTSAHWVAPECLEKFDAPDDADGLPAGFREFYFNNTYSNFSDDDFVEFFATEVDREGQLDRRFAGGVSIDAPPNHR